MISFPWTFTLICVLVLMTLISFAGGCRSRIGDQDNDRGEVAEQDQCEARIAAHETRLDRLRAPGDAIIE